MSWPNVETFSGSHQLSMLVFAPPRPDLLLHHLDRDLRGGAGLHLDLFRRLPERLVPHLDRLLAGRRVLDLAHAVAVGDGEERMRHDGDPAEHPAVDVARDL